MHRSSNVRAHIKQRSDAHHINQHILDRTRTDAWEDVAERLIASHHRILAVIESYSEDDLFTKQRFA